MVHGPPSNYRALSSLSRINLLNELQQRGSQTVGQLAEATGLHHNTAREHLHRLIDAGLVSSEPISTTRKGRPRILYRASTRRSDASTRSRIQATRVTRLQPPTAADVTAEQLHMLAARMDDFGIDAVIEPGRLQMVMHDCPFAELAKEHPQVCRVHFELVKDALQSTDGPVRARKLHPFFTASDCVADLQIDGN